MTPHTVAVPACVAAFLLAGVPATFAQTPRLVIASPTAGDYVSDRVPIDVRLEPTDAAPVVTEHVFYADGKEVCRVPGPARPVCVWDAGAVVTSHQLRVVATLAAGGRLVASVRTRAIDVAENTSVRVVQVPVVATDRDGRFAAGLTRDAFSLTEDATYARLLSN